MNKNNIAIHLAESLLKVGFSSITTIKSIYLRVSNIIAIPTPVKRDQKHSRAKICIHFH